MAALKLPKDSETQARLREAEIQRATLQAARVPLQVAQMAARVIELAAQIVEIGNLNAISDGASGAAMARAALTAAGYNIRINLNSLTDTTAAEALRAELRQAEARAETAEARLRHLLKRAGESPPDAPDSAAHRPDRSRGLLPRPRGMPLRRSRLPFQRHRTWPPRRPPPRQPSLPPLPRCPSPPRLRPPPPAALPRETCPDAPFCLLNGHFWFERPIPPQGQTAIARSYPYGSTQNGQREVHHGVEFENPQGTPVLAAAAGRGGLCRRRPPDAAGLGARRFTETWWCWNMLLNGETFFTLYGHLHRIAVSTGQHVQAGQALGESRRKRHAIGSHLHFEVRRGANDYFATRNPELWLKPLEGTGVLAGRIVDERGQPVKGMVNVQRVENGTLNSLSVGSAATYPPAGVNSDDDLRETFVLGELPAGEYRLSLVHLGVLYERIVPVEPGKLTFVNFFVK